jgi:hypothetical protein
MEKGRVRWVIKEANGVMGGDMQKSQAAGRAPDVPLPSESKRRGELKTPRLFLCTNPTIII